MRKPFEALRTSERFLSGVKPDVLREVVLVLELLVAPVAQPRTLICKIIKILKEGS